VGVITHPVPLDSGLSGRRLPLGRPIPNVRIHLLGADLVPVPLGVPGELYIGGASVARGYLGRPGLTAERFVPDPFAPEAGARLYRTGDRARRLPSGELLFLGRMDDQLKFHGYRIEPNEIRSALNRHAKIRDSVIVLKRDLNGRDALVAYYVSRQELDPEELRDFLSSSVIEETIPNLFVHLKKLPLTLNGKINFQALPGLDEIRGKAQQELVAPRTPTEEALADIWQSVLGINGVSVHDNFFQLGGHSLLATRVLSRIREAFGISPPLRTLFEKPTIARLAPTITQLQADQEEGDEMTRLLQEISGLSGEELQKALNAEMRLQEDESHL
jgi:acyl carrier protein